MRNLTVDIYRKNGERSYIFSKSIEEVASELKRLIGQINPDPILKSLLLQRENINLFPNVMLFLDDNKQMTIDEFMTK